jgi:DnaK suppressor protein
MDFDLLRTTLEMKLASMLSSSDKRADIVIQQSPDALDQTQFAAERDLVVSLLNRDAEMSRRLQGALRRMDDGSYGICLACEDPISAKRLQAVPWAELCLGCQSMADLNASGVLTDHDHGVELEIA